jgi:hypothetical protein
MTYRVIFPVTAEHTDEMLRHICGATVKVLKAMDTTFNHLGDCKIPFVAALPGPGSPHPDLLLHMNPDPGTLTCYYWGEEGPTREQVATAFIDLPGWMVDSLPIKYNCVKVEIPLDPNDKVLVEFFHNIPNNNRHIRTVHLVDGQWEKLQSY